jgi:hypothetical protein
MHSTEGLREAKKQIPLDYIYLIFLAEGSAK